MLVFFSVLVFVCLFSYLSYNKLKPKTILSIVFGSIWLMLVLQEGWGGDWYSYVDYFARFHRMSFSELLTDKSHGEIGYKIFMSIMPSQHFTFTVGMAIYCFSVAFLFFHFIPQKWWPLALIFFFMHRAMMMGAVSSFARMAIANSCLIYAVYALTKNHKKYFILLILFGALFHKSLVFMAPLVFLRPNNFKMSMTTIFAVFVGLLIFSFVAPSVWVNVVDGFIEKSDVLESYSYYMETDETIQTKGLSMIIIFFWLYMLIKNYKEEDLPVEYYILFGIALLRMVFDMLPSVGLASRIYYYLDYYFIASFMVMLNREKNGVLQAALVVSLLLMFIVNGFVPYSKTMFFQEHWGTYYPIF